MNRLVQARTAALFAAAVLICTAACERGSDGPRSGPSPTPTPPSVTERLHSLLLVRDGGHHFWASPGQSVLVRLAGSSLWGDLSASAGTVEEVYYRTDPGYREWRATLPAKGTVTLVARCDGCSQDPWRVVVVVRSAAP